METRVHPRISKRKFISRVASRSDQSIKLVGEVYEALLEELTEATQ